MEFWLDLLSTRHGVAGLPAFRCLRAALILILARPFSYKPK